MTKTFHIYRSSAGSGKTRMLAKEYLMLALAHRSHYFRHILAVTFTNKSTQEMKDRILSYLHEFSTGKDNELSGELKRELALDDSTFRERSQEVQREILHHYSQFSISTIDAFFQKVIRSFSRESQLMGDYRLEVENEMVLEEVINQLIDELGDNKELTNWVVEFANDSLQNDKSWDIRLSLREFANQIFKEEFKMIEEDLIKETNNHHFFKNLSENLNKIRVGFIRFITEKAKEALSIVEANNLTVDDFKYGGGIHNLFTKASTIRSVSDFDEKAKGKRSVGDFLKAGNWPAKETRHTKLILQLAEQRLLPILMEINAFWNGQYERSLSAELTLSKFYSFGLIADISRKLRHYKEQNNLMLLADASKFLNGVIQESDTPFIYEKVGSFYRNFLIDEFQDTSGYQWKNFFPLVTNSLDQGNRSFVVGDVKQAIYRWRGGDLTLLQRGIESQIGSYRVGIQELDTNYRSSPIIVAFNNALFKAASQLVAQITDSDLPTIAYREVQQKAHHVAPLGYVRIQFIEEEERDWNEVALEKIPLQLEELQHQGVKLGDIAILVRRKEEGHRIAAHLLTYKNSAASKPGCRYEVVSDESLRLDGAAAVNLLLSAMRYLLNPEDVVARAQLGYEFARANDPEKKLSEVFTVWKQVIFESNLPGAFTQSKAWLKKLPLFELTETLIDIFKIGEKAGELPYLQAFQDVVLEFYSRERNDLGAFLEWWEENKGEKSIKVPGDVDAAQIITIHKSKGLQFKYVLVPFCSWSLDHEWGKAPILWVKSDEPIFREAGYLPVAYSSRLKESFFKSYYQEELVRSYLDNLNLIYVAFTRSAFGLIVMAPHPSNDRNKHSAAKLLHECLSNDETLKKSWVEDSIEWASGELTAYPIKSPGFRSVSLERYPVARWRDKLVIKKSSASYFESQDEEKLQKIRYGLHMHAVLSRIHHAHQVPNALEMILKDGLITEAEKQPLQQQLDQLLSQPQISDWFDSRWEVRTEVPVLLPGGEESRIDRLMIHGQKVVVIDFKTGEHNKKDRQQVVDYLNTLRQMGFTDADGFLLYLRDREVVNIKDQVIKSVKRKMDKDQLSLGI